MPWLFLFLPVIITSCQSGHTLRTRNPPVIRLVYPKVKVNGRWMDHIDVLNHPLCKRLLCDEPTLDFYRYRRRHLCYRKSNAQANV